VQNVSGYFILPGKIDTPFIYRIRRLRDGGIYSLRGVDVFQDRSAAASQTTAPCFVATVSFKRRENTDKWVAFEHQNPPKDFLDTEYQSVLEGKNIEEHPLAPGFDALWWEGEDAEEWSRLSAVFPGVETRKVDMTKYNGTVEEGGGPDGQGASRWRQLLFYRLIIDEDGEEQDDVDLNLHAAAHMYAGDRNSIFLIQRALGYEQRVTPMASLSYTVVFQGPIAERLRMTDSHGRPKWFVQESWTSHSGDNRGCHESRLIDYETGQLVGRTLQDGMIRVPSTEAGKAKRTYEHGLKEERAKGHALGSSKL